MVAEFSVKAVARKQRSACIVVGVFEPRRAFLLRLQNGSTKLATDTSAALLRRGERWKENRGRLICCIIFPNVLSERILLIGCGKRARSLMNVSISGLFRKR